MRNDADNQSVCYYTKYLQFTDNSVIVSRSPDLPGFSSVPNWFKITVS